MAPRSRIQDGDDVNLDDIETTPHADDVNGDQPGDEDPEEIEVEFEDELEDEEPSSEETLAARQPQRNGQQPPATTRGARRAQTLANENRALRDQLAELKGRFDQFAENSTRAATPAAPRETPEQLAQRRALMTDREILEEELRNFRGEVTGALNTTRGQLADQADRSAFDQKLARHPKLKRFLPDIERMQAELRRNNQAAPREMLLKIAMGEHDLQMLESPEYARKVAAARDRVRRATTRPGNNSSDAGGGGRRRGGASLEDRLADQPL